ncbi:MAG: glutamine-hydrolyzing carbamoyl-phosphate synthase small subunit [Gemmatimonadota bacterium]
MLLTQPRDGYLLLEDGTRFDGHVPTDARTGVGEVVFTTNMTGYQEVLTDPSYAGQIVVMTAPMMGVYGTRGDDAQSRRPWVAGFLVRELSSGPEGWRSEGSLEGYLEEHDIPTLVGVDTRMVTRHIRDAGAMRGVIAPSSLDEAGAMERLRAEPSMKGRDLATEVSTPEPYELEADGVERGRVLCMDYGVKRRSLDLIRRSGYRVRVVPADTSADELLAADASGVFVSNGPGDPDAVPGAVERIRALAEAEVPLFGICLGHQLVARTFGGRNFKLRYGHRGGNHPVRNLDTGRVEITSQNHGFSVEGDAEGVAAAEDLRVTHMNLNDGTIEGLEHRELPVFAVQYHPESAPGPHDSRYLFDRFVTAMSSV